MNRASFYFSCLSGVIAVTFFALWGGLYVPDSCKDLNKFYNDGLPLEEHSDWEKLCRKEQSDSLATLKSFLVSEIVTEFVLDSIRICVDFIQFMEPKVVCTYALVGKCKYSIISTTP